MTCSELSSLILQNSDSIAFLVGNGIHLYEQKEKNIDGKFDWNELIIKVRQELLPYNSERISYRRMSLPEKFDVIVHESLASKTNLRFSNAEQDLFPQIESLATNTISEYPNYDKFLGQRPYGDRPNHIVLNSLVNNDRLQQAKKDLLQSIENILKSIGLKLNPNSLDVQNIALHIALGDKPVDYVAKLIIKSLFEHYSLKEWIFPFIQVAYKLKAPILTTNYDTSLSKLVHLSPRIAVDANNKIQEGFPFETYFAKSPINHPWDSFAIWHIHGLYNYVNSIRIGRIDYENLQREIQARLNMTQNPVIDSHWDSNNSWLSILFHKNLFIVGLGLEKDEEVLWWLFKERNKYNLKGWYVYIDKENVVGTKAKKLRDVGLEIIRADKVDLYENVWKQIISKI